MNAMTNVPSGYKQTEVGVIPEDWDVDSFSSVTPSNGRNGIVDGPFGSNLKTIHYRKSGVPIVTSGFVTDGQFYADSYLYVDKEKFEDEKRSAVQPGDIVMAKIGARCGASAILPEWHQVSILSGNALKITVDQSRHSTFYIWQVLWNLYLRGRMEALRTVGAQPAISMAQLKQYKIPLPPLPEQRAIATALSDVDALLAAQDKLIAKKRDIKQAAMQQLLTGKQRLPGFSGEWEEKTIEELEKAGVVKLSRGKVISKKDIANTPGDNPIYSSSVKNDGLFGCYGEHMFDEEMITWSVDGGGHFFHRAKHKFSVTNVCGFMRVDTAKLGYRFLAAQLQLLHSKLKFDYQDKAHPSIIRKAYSVLIPSMAEQAAIATVLSDMDADLTALEQQRDKTRALKQGMMQELLTGRIRLV